MPTIFNTIFPDEMKMSMQNVQVLVDSYHERQKTGVIRLGYALEKYLYFLFKRGELLNTYLVTPEKWEALVPERGAEWMHSAGDAYARPIPLSSFGLLTTKLLVQSHSSSTKVAIRHTQLAEQLSALSNRKESTLTHLAWKNAAGMIFFAPNCEPHFSFVSQDIILDESGSYKALSEWDETECSLTIFSPDLEVEAWQEYYLRSAYTHICEASLARFEVLTGHALVDSLARLLNVYTDRQNLQISIARRSLTDNEVFSTPQQALYNYRYLLAELFEHFSAVIGPRLYASTMREIVKKLPEYELKAARGFELLSKGYFYE